MRTKTISLLAFLCLTLISYGQTYFQKHIYNGSPSWPPSFALTSDAGLQLSASSHGIVNISTTDFTVVFNSMFNNGTLLPSSPDGTCKYPTANFQTSAVIKFYPDFVQSMDVVEVDPQRGILAVTGYVMNGMYKDLFVMLIDIYGKVYLTKKFSMGLHYHVIPKAICTNPANPNLMYITGYLDIDKPGAFEKKLMAMKLEYTYNPFTNQAGLNLIWYNNYDRAYLDYTTYTWYRDLTNSHDEVGNDIFCQVQTPPAAYPVLHIVGYVEQRDAAPARRAICMELDEHTGKVSNATSPTSPRFSLIMNPIEYITEFKKVNTAHDGTIYFSGDASYADGSKATLLGDFSGVPFNMVSVQKYEHPVGGVLKSMLISRNEYIYLFEQQSYDGATQTGGIRVVDRFNLSLPPHYLDFPDFYHPHITWTPNDITEDVMNNYITLHSTVEESGSSPYTMINNIYHNGERGDNCPEVNWRNFPGTQTDMQQAGFVRSPHELIETPMCEELETPHILDVCWSDADQQGTYIPNGHGMIKSGISEISLSDFRCYPTLLNSETRSVTIDVRSGTQAKIQLNVYDQLGKKVEHTVDYENPEKIVINLPANLKPGIYYISISTGSNTISYKLMKN